MTPISSDEETKYGRLNHLPPGALQRAAEKAGVPVSSLSTLTVPKSRSMLYNVVLEYAAMCGPLRDPHHPLLVNRCESEYSSSEYDTDSASDNDTDGWSDDDSHLEASLASKEEEQKPDRFPVPKYYMGFGETVLTWPPPEQFSAQKIREERDEKIKIRKAKREAKREELRKARAARAANAEGQSEGNEKQKGDQKKVEKAGEKKEDKAEEKVKEKREQKVEQKAGKEEKDDDNKDILANGGKSVGKKSVGDSVLENGTMEDHSKTKHKTDSAVKETKEIGKEITVYVLHYYLSHPTDYREITLISAESHKTLQRFASELLVWKTEKDFYPVFDDGFHLYRYTAGDKYWEHEGRKQGRQPSSIVLPKGQLESILRDIRNFLKPSTKRWYRAHGLPQRRSFLFYGPPGTGKTSTILCIASTFKLNCCFLRMTATLTDQMLSDALKGCPSRALLILEDIDTLFNEDRENIIGGRLTFSGLLNALDGLTSVEKMMTIMTTNHIHKLDPALIRGGRVDRRIYFERPNEEQIKDFFSSFYPEASEELREKFLKAVQEIHEGEGEARSIATLQQLFIRERESTAEECVAAVPEFYKEHFPSRAGKDKGNLYL